ncbi:hypothetical protein C8J56DRAFT_1006603 [Mycena floridula]|nr:hypothetical protein C8J56DRAFT_1006603 [Mycena floridula]
MSRLVALILGAGPNVGKSVAATLKSYGYQIALGSRNPDFEGVKADGYFAVRVDVSNTDSIIEAFATVNKDLGPPNVVIYNAATHTSPPDAADPLSLSLEKYQESVDFITGTYVAAQQALKGFRAEVHKKSPKVFINTGNLLPFIEPEPERAIYMGLASVKSTQAYLVHLFSNAYAKEGIRFHFAHLIGEDGSLPYADFPTSGPAHGKAYWRLISSENAENWDYRFTKDGRKYLGY